MRFDQYGYRFLKDGDLVGDLCFHCGGDLICVRKGKEFRVTCGCKETDMSMKEWAEWIQHRERTADYDRSIWEK